MVSVHVRVLLINGGSKQPDVLVKVPMRLVALKLVSPTQPVWRVSLLNFFSALSAYIGIPKMPERQVHLYPSHLLHT